MFYFRILREGCLLIRLKNKHVSVRWISLVGLIIYFFLKVRVRIRVWVRVGIRGEITVQGEVKVEEIVVRIERI